MFEGVEEHTELKVLDYSWNVVGIFSVGSLQKSNVYYYSQC